MRQINDRYLHQGICLITFSRFMCFLSQHANAKMLSWIHHPCLPLLWSLRYPLRFVFNGHSLYGYTLNVTFCRHLYHTWSLLDRKWKQKTIPTHIQPSPSRERTNFFGEVIIVFCKKCVFCSCKTKNTAYVFQNKLSLRVLRFFAVVDFSLAVLFRYACGGKCK